MKFYFLNDTLTTKGKSQEIPLPFWRAAIVVGPAREGIQKKPSVRSPFIYQIRQMNYISHERYESFKEQKIPYLTIKLKINIITSIPRLPHLRGLDIAQSTLVWLRVWAGILVKKEDIDKRVTIFMFSKLHNAHSSIY